MFSFDLDRAYCLALAAETVYADAAVIEQTVLDQWRFSHFQFYDVDETQCFVAASDEAVIVAFRGTEADRVTDWITDLEFGLVDGSFGGKVHEGFWESLSNVWELVNRQVASLTEDGRRALWVTGHSLGAALATLAVARWRENQRAVAGLYAFGQPRTGDRTFSRNFDFDFKPYTFRIVNHHDIVTRTPPRVLGYRHTGTFKYINDAGELMDHIGWWRIFLRGWSGKIDNLFSWCGHGLNDHSMTCYRKRLEDQMSRSSASEPPEHESPRLEAKPAVIVAPRRDEQLRRAA